MKAVILAGGFAKRMWPLTKGKPKHLLPVGGRPMLDYVIRKLEPVLTFDQILISTNARFEGQFRSYLEDRENRKDISVFVEDTRSEGEKLGSVGALGRLIRESNIDDELLVVGGDNILGFEMTDLMVFYRSKRANVVALHDLESREKAKLYGVVSIDRDNKIIDFQEKPDEPRSTLVSTACYAFTRNGVRNILRYLDGGNNPDKMGHFIEWLYRKDDVYGFVFGGVWFDIGSFESYEEANRYFSKLDTR